MAKEETETVVSQQGRSQEAGVIRFRCQMTLLAAPEVKPAQVGEWMVRLVRYIFSVAKEGMETEVFHEEVFKKLEQFVYEENWKQQNESLQECKFQRVYFLHNSMNSRKLLIQ